MTVESTVITEKKGKEEVPVKEEFIGTSFQSRSTLSARGSSGIINDLPLILSPAEEHLSQVSDNENERKELRCTSY